MQVFTLLLLWNAFAVPGNLVKNQNYLRLPEVDVLLVDHEALYSKLLEMKKIQSRSSPQGLFACLQEWICSSDSSCTTQAAFTKVAF